MEDRTTNDRPTMTWVPVTDARGRVHLEARWTQVPRTPVTTHAA